MYFHFHLAAFPACIDARGGEACQGGNYWVIAQFFLEGFFFFSFLYFVMAPRPGFSTLDFANSLSS